MPASSWRGARNDTGREHAAGGIPRHGLLSVREQFTDEQWAHFATVRRFVDEEVVPVIGPY